MKSSSLVLLPTMSFGTANEDYDGVSPDFAGLDNKAASYYTKDRNMQTIAWHTVDFEGEIVIEATLNGDTSIAEYFEIGRITGGDNGTGGYIPLTEDDFLNVEGNFTWIRARVVGYAAGDITRVTLSY